MAKQKKVKDPNKKSVWQEFKDFISRGNVLDMAVGVIIGGAFSAIVTALVNILMSLCTWGVPGGINGLVTVLPAANAVQEGLAGIGQKFDASQLNEMTKIFATNVQEIAEADQTAAVLQNAQSALLGKYTLYGTTYVYNLSASINWGAFINAVISFLIIAITLFIVVKVANKMALARAKAKAKIEAAIAEQQAKQEEQKEEQAE